MALTPDQETLIAAAITAGWILRSLEGVPLAQPVTIENHPWEWGNQILLEDGGGHRVCLDIHSEPFGEDVP